MGARAGAGGPVSWDADNIARSVRRYVTDMLGPPWAIDLERTEVSDADRPGGLIEIGLEQVRFARRTIPQGNVSAFRSVTVTLYPSLDAPRRAGRTARHLADGLMRLIVIGADGPMRASGRPASGPETLPLYDYSMVALDGTVEERTGPEFAFDVMWAEDYSCRALQDPMDAQRWSVILEMRLSYEYPGRVSVTDQAAPIVGSLPGGWGGVPDPDPPDPDGLFIEGEAVPGA